jgi:hypothetical protein
MDRWAFAAASCHGGLPLPVRLGADTSSFFHTTGLVTCTARAWLDVSTSGLSIRREADGLHGWRRATAVETHSPSQGTAIFMARCPSGALSAGPD